MSVRHEKQLHVMIGRKGSSRLDEIADAEGIKKSELLRRVLSDFVVSYDSQHSRQLTRKPDTNFGTGPVRDRYKIP